MDGIGWGWLRSAYPAIAPIGTFPQDLIEPVPKGDYGGVVLQRILGPTGQQCGAILWESIRPTARTAAQVAPSSANAQLRVSHCAETKDSLIVSFRRASTCSVAV